MNDETNFNYEGKTYQIKNELYPYLLDEVKEWPCSLAFLSDSIQYANKDRFAAKWLSEHKLSKEAKDLLKAGKKVYQLFYEHSSELPWVKYSISFWDVGWYQIRMSLKNEGLCLSDLENVKEKHRLLGEKLLPEIENYGFLSGGEVEWFEET